MTIFQNVYWKSVSKFQGIKGQNYDSNKFSNNKVIITLSLEYLQFNLGFSQIIRLRLCYKYNTTIAIRMGRVSEDCPKSCPCCGEGNQSFEHWIFKCDALASFRWNSLNFIDDLYVLFIRKIRALNPLSSYDSISDFEDYINHYIYLFLLGKGYYKCKLTRSVNAENAVRRGQHGPMSLKEKTIISFRQSIQTLIQNKNFLLKQKSYNLEVRFVSYELFF